MGVWTKILSATMVLAALIAWAMPGCGQSAAGGTPPTAAGTTADGRPRQIRGFSMQLNNPSPAAVKEYLAAIDEISQMGCTSINFVIAARQDDVHATTLHMAWQNTPTERDILKIMKHAKAKGMYTIMMPIVLLDKAGPKEWRGVIAPPDSEWPKWFDSYRLYIKKMALYAQQCNVDLFCVGSELLSTESRREDWLETIKEIRSVYKGKLTYSANWDHYEVPTFWDQVDYIGMNNYNELAKEPGASVKQLDDAWRPIKDKILAFVAKKKKPFLFTEVGWHNLRNTIPEPWNYVVGDTTPIDLGEQKRAYESFVETWGNVGTDQFMGALVWEWRPGENGVKTKGAYSLQGTPAMEVVRKWMAGAK